MPPRRRRLRRRRLRLPIWRLNSRRRRSISKRRRLRMKPGRSRKTKSKKSMSQRFSNLPDKKRSRKPSSIGKSTSSPRRPRSTALKLRQRMTP